MLYKKVINSQDCLSQYHCLLSTGCQAFTKQGDLLVCPSIFGYVCVGYRSHRGSFPSQNVQLNFQNTSCFQKVLLDLEKNTRSFSHRMVHLLISISLFL